VSRSFVSALSGIAMTLLAWYGPWAWPAWPAFTALRLAFGTGEVYDEMTNAWRAVVVVALIVINIAFWGLLVYGSQRLAGSVRNRAKA
jgi:hypothetical protein